MATLPQKLGVIAGGGALPRKLHAFCDSNNVETFTIAFDGQTDPETVAGRAHDMTRIGAAGKILETLRARGIKDLVIIGAVKRPKLSEMRPDLRTVAFYAKIGMRALGDDGLLKALRRELEEEGFIIHGIDEFIPDLLMPAGVLTRAAPDDVAYEYIHAGLMESRQIGKRDIGQSVVVLGNDLLGTEDDNGTNALIKRAAVKGAILVKSSKPQQDRKLDMPTIGSETVHLCASLGYSGIAAEAGGVLMADRDEMIAAADAAGLFVVGV